jgi:plastocyanin
MTLARRHLLCFASALTFVRAAPSLAEEPVTVRMRSDADGGHVGFDPVGLLIQPGRTVRFLCEANYHTTSAYHPANTAHSLRIPRTAQPWSSDVLQPGDVFEVTLSTPGVYDYFCVPHEEAGMVGRLIVGQAIGPGSQPFDWFKGRTEGRGWLSVPAAARAVFPSTEEIMRRGSVPAKLVGMTH